MINKIVRLDIGKAAPKRIIDCTEGDTMWTWHFQIYNNGVRWSLPIGASATFCGLKKDGNVFDVSATISDNEVVVNCTDQMTAVDGDVYSVVRVVDEAGKIVASCPAVLRCKPNPQSLGTLSDSVLSAYDEATQALGTALGDLNSVVEWINQRSSSLQASVLDVSLYTPNGVPLTVSNFATAIENALDAGSCLYIPAGTYNFDSESPAVVIEKNCHIFIDEEAEFSTSTLNPCILVRNCSVQIEGGTFSAGTDDFDEQNWDRSFVYGSNSAAVGIISLTGAHDCSIRNIRSTHSKYGSVIYMRDCENVLIENCKFDKMLHSGINIYKYNKNVIVRNCSFTKMRYKGTDYYCYALCTSMPLNTKTNVDYDTPPEVIATPPDGLVVENCYVEDSEDSGIDTHGASNVVFRNNIVKNTVCAITAYNDSRRATRPNGWTMRNVLIENNICDSTRPEVSGATWHHPFFLLGNVNYQSASVSGYEDRPGSFDGFSNLVVRNNYIRQTGGNNLVSLNNCSKNVLIENNVLDNGSGAGEYFSIGRCFNFKIINNIGKGTENTVVFDHCYGEWRDNINIGATWGNAYGISYIRGIDYGESGVSTTTPSVRFGDILYESVGIVNICNTYGVRAIEDKTPNAYKSFSVSVAGDIIEVDNVFVIPNLALLIDGKNVYVKDVIDSKHFSIYSVNDLTDGTYTCSLRYATLLQLANQS